MSRTGSTAMRKAIDCVLPPATTEFELWQRQINRIRAAYLASKPSKRIEVKNG